MNIVIILRILSSFREYYHHFVNIIINLNHFHNFVNTIINLDHFHNFGSITLFSGSLLFRENHYPFWPLSSFRNDRDYHFENTIIVREMPFSTREYYHNFVIIIKVYFSFVNLKEIYFMQFSLVFVEKMLIICFVMLFAYS